MSNSPVMSPNGINHLALASSDIKKTLQFFNRVLGMPLVSLYWMHGAENTVHGFLKLNEHSLLAFVGHPEISAEPQFGVTHAGNPANPCVGGTMQHLAFNVDSHDDLLAVRDRIRANGIHCLGPLDHGMMQSIYFAGPESMTLEITYMTGEDATQWIDQSALDHVGISADELEELKNPAPFERPNASLANPSLDEGNEEYRLHYEPEAYAQLISLPDDVLSEMMKDNVPPAPAD